VLLRRSSRAGRTRPIQSGQFGAGSDNHDDDRRHLADHDCTPAEQHHGRARVDDHAPRRIPNDTTRDNQPPRPHLHDATVIIDDDLVDVTRTDVDDNAYPLKALTGSRVTVMVLPLQSNLPGVVGATRTNLPFCTCIPTRHLLAT